MTPITKPEHLPITLDALGVIDTYIHNSYHNEEYCNMIFVPGAPAMICHRCGLHGHVMLDCRETVCTWCERFGHFIENCPDFGWTFSNLESSKLARVVLRFHPQHVWFHFYFLQSLLEQHAMNACSFIFTFFHACYMLATHVFHSWCCASHLYFFIKHMQNMLWPCVTHMFYYIYTLVNYHVTLASLCSNTKTFLIC